MNKFVYIKYYLFLSFIHYQGIMPSDFMEKYGMLYKYNNADEYQVVDESKFALFMLRHPDLIERIVY